MPTESLEQLAQGYSFRNVKLLGDLRVGVHADQAVGMQAVAFPSSTLTYNPQLVLEDASGYIARQSEVHQEHYATASKELSVAYREFYSVSDAMRAVEKQAQFLPADATRVGVEVAKLCVAPLFWSRLETLRGALQESIRLKQVAKRGYSCVSEVVEYGERFLEDVRLGAGVASSTHDKLAAWRGVQKKLAHVYRRFVSEVDKRVRAEHEQYTLLFPDAKSLL